MSFFLIVGIAVALAMDTFAVSIGLAVGLKGLSISQSFRLAFHFGLFQFLMNVAGWAAGENIVRLIEHYDHWAAFALLALVGGKMIHEFFEREAGEEKKYGSDPTRGFSLVVLAVATSIDSLAVGLSFGALHIKILYAAAVIGIVTFLISSIGAKIGPFLGRLAGKRAELAGGIVLILIGVKILIDHL